MKLLVGLIVAAVVVLATAGGGAYFWWNRALSPVAPQNSNGVKVKNISLTVEKNDTGYQIISKLAELRVIRSEQAARIYLRLSGVDKQIRPGTYSLDPGWPTPRILEELTKGPQDVWVTFPEGWRREEFAARLDSILTGPTSRFDPQQFIADTASLEGQLFPDTYLIPSDADSAKVIDLLRQNFFAKTGLKMDPAASDSSGMTDLQVLTLASLVEREARTDPDRLLVAQILQKRFAEDWLLQVDAGIQYAEGSLRCARTPLSCKWWQPVTSTDLKSAYNTYQTEGFPPTPICNPGLAAIQAAISTRKPFSNPYWYYLTDPQGITHYSKTLPEHNLNVDKYLRS